MRSQLNARVVRPQ